MALTKRSVLIAGHATSVSLEDEFWQALKAIAERRGTPLGRLIERIDGDRATDNLSSALRLYVLRTLQDEIAAQVGRSA